MKEYIGVFDSGVGGLTVLNCARQMMPAEHFLYFADSANVPYGEKLPKQIIELVDAAVKTMTTKYPLKALLIACNTATSVAVQHLRDHYDIPIIGMEPAVKSAIKMGDPRKILVLATSLTLRQDKYHQLITDLEVKDQVETIAAGGLVDLAEEFELEGPDVKKYLKKLLSSVDIEDYHSIVLGCTHFLYFHSALRECIPPQIDIVDGHLGTVKNLAKQINARTLGQGGELKCMLSGLEVSPEVLMPYLNFLQKQLDPYSLNGV